MMKYDALASLGAAGMMDIHALAQWISMFGELCSKLFKTSFFCTLFVFNGREFFYLYPGESNLDPNDPANADIMSLVKVILLFDCVIGNLVTADIWKLEC